MDLPPSTAHHGKILNPSSHPSLSLSQFLSLVLSEAGVHKNLFPYVQIKHIFYHAMFKCTNNLNSNNFPTLLYNSYKMVFIFRKKERNGPQIIFF